MFHLPPELILMIYEYANPYKNDYDKVLVEFKYKKLIDQFQLILKYNCCHGNCDVLHNRFAKFFLSCIRSYGFEGYLYLERERQEEWERELEEEWQSQYDYYKNIYSECIKTLK
jgi:hypothetical protein